MFVDKPRLAPSIPTWVCSSLSSITMSWRYPHPKPPIDLPLILGFELQIRGSGRACEAQGETAWRTAAALQVLTYEDIVRNRQDTPTKVAVRGLAGDTAYCFQIRALTAGGWGPFSGPSLDIRTQSATHVADSFGTIKAVIDGGGGATDIARVMSKHKHFGALQRQGVEILAKMALQGTRSTVRIVDGITLY